MWDILIGELPGNCVKLYALMTPPAVLGAFLAGTKHQDYRQKRKIALKTSATIFTLGSILYVFGSNIFEFFGFTLDAFRIGSSVLLLLTAIGLIDDNDTANKVDPEADISIVPLAVPLGMGPASIGAVMVMGAGAEGLYQTLAGLLALLLASGAMYALLLLSEPVSKILRATGVAALSKLTGLLLAAIAAQVMFTGVTNFLR